MWLLRLCPAFGVVPRCSTCGPSSTAPTSSRVGTSPARSCCGPSRWPSPLRGSLRTRLYSSSVIDDLTGLLNRGAFDRAFSREIARADRHEIALTVVLFDIDHFKQVNDLPGHAAGDEALRRFSSVIAAEVRVIDVATRIGGEEFAVLLPGCDRGDGRRFAERVCARLQLVTSRDGRDRRLVARLLTSVSLRGQQPTKVETAQRGLLAALSQLKVTPRTCPQSSVRSRIDQRTVRRRSGPRAANRALSM
jgi:diguanylate cyclase (GGDEF)-like protein